MRTLTTLHAPSFLARHARAVKAVVLALLAAALALIAGTAGGAEPNLQGLLGASHQKDGGGRLVTGVRAEIGDPAWIMRPEVGWQYREAVLGDRAET